MKVRKGDTVKVMRGRDRGKSAKVIDVFPEAGRLTVDGVNLYKKRVRPRRQGQKGETVMVARPLSASNIMLVCRNCGKAVRVGRHMEGNQKVRYCKKCGATT